MDAKTLEALKGSIAKWEAIVAGTGKDNGPENCPLCQLFNKADVSFLQACDGCPVKARSGQPFCRATPYPEFEEADWGADRNVARAAQAAQAELDFLRSLLPTE